MRHLTPFAAAALLAWVAVPLGSTVDWLPYECACGLLFVSALLALLSTSGALRPTWGQVPASLAYMAAVGMLRGSAGGIYSGVDALALIPVFYTALYSPHRRHLYVLLGALALFYLLGAAIGGVTAHPGDLYREALLTFAVSAIVGLTTQNLVARIRRQAEDSGRRERMLQQVGLAVSRLFDSDDPRSEACDAARTVSGASAAILFERTDSGDVVSTATAGMDVGPVTFPAAAVHPLHTAFATGLPRLISGLVEACSVYPELWEACGGPESILYQPVVRGDDVIGVLAVGWPTAMRASGARATVVALLAHEAGLAISRADEISALARTAQTDPLTGLPNRRAWDERLAHAAEAGEAVTIAMLDLDNFKRFNDTFGHPAGDRLLKATAAAWRDALRTEDLVARLGGEEFGVLLFDCDRPAALQVTERLRELVADGQTCSVGIAVRQPDEPIDTVLARADAALYHAKSTGRDRACISV